MNKDTRSLLKLRAVNMASEPELESDTSAAITIIEFSLDAENYGIESQFVMEVFSLKDFTALPGVPAYILGLVNLRGQILPVIDLRRLFNLPWKGLGELNKVIVLHNEQMEFGVLADEVNGVKAVLIDDLLPVPSIITGKYKKYLMGLTKESLIVLSAENLLTDKNIIVNEVVT
jgi:purine-binding chemotaxis protein CheW